MYIHGKYQGRMRSIRPNGACTGRTSVSLCLRHVIASSPFCARPYPLNRRPVPRYSQRLNGAPRASHADADFDPNQLTDLIQLTLDPVRSAEHQAEADDEMAGAIFAQASAPQWEYEPPLTEPMDQHTGGGSSSKAGSRGFKRPSRPSVILDTELTNMGARMNPVYRWVLKDSRDAGQLALVQAVTSTKSFSHSQ